MLLRTLILVAIVALSLSTAPASENQSAYDPEQFTITYWAGPPAKFHASERYAEIKEANFTLAFPPDHGYTREQILQKLDFCQQHGLKAVIYDGRMSTSIGGSADRKTALGEMVADYSKHPALLGYSVTDEPNAAAFPGLAEVVAYLKEKDPAHPAFINLNPTYAREFPGALGTTTYEEYVRRFVDTVKPAILSYDHYHFTQSGDRPDFFENLATIRKIALEKNVPFWNIVLVTQHFGYRHLTEPELRFEAMQTLAFGARGLVWFTYWMPAGVPAPESWKHSLILADGTRDPHYDMVKRINADTKAIGDALGKAKSIDVYQTGKPPTTAPSIVANSPRMGPKADSPIRILGEDGDLTVGVFHDHDGKSLALIANRDYRALTKTRATISPVNAAVEQFDPATKSWSPAAHAERGVIPLDLPPGAAVLLRW